MSHITNYLSFLSLHNQTLNFTNWHLFCVLQTFKFTTLAFVLCLAVLYLYYVNNNFAPPQFLLFRWRKKKASKYFCHSRFIMKQWKNFSSLLFLINLHIQDASSSKIEDQLVYFPLNNRMMENKDSYYSFDFPKPPQTPTSHSHSLSIFFFCNFSFHFLWPF